MPDVIYTDDLRKILSDKSLDIILVTTPNRTHYAIAKQLLEDGFNVLVDKPFSLYVDEAEKLIKIAEKKGLFIQPYQNRRFDSDFLTAQKVIRDGVLGDLIEVEFHFDYYRPQVPRGLSLKRENSFIYSHGCHTIDQILSFFGIPRKVHYDMRQLNGKNKMNDYYDIDMDYGEFKVSAKASYYRVNSRPAIIVTGKNGQFVKKGHDKQEAHLKLGYMPGQPDFGVDDPSEYGMVSFYDEKGNYHRETVKSCRGDYADFYRQIYGMLTGPSNPPVSKEEILVQMAILEDGYQALVNRG